MSRIFKTQDDSGMSPPGDAGVTVRQLTEGPMNHYFGYIGQCRTIPWNATGRYILCLETEFQDRLPEAGDPAGVCLYDTTTNTLRVIDRTRGWNPQQGTMFYWNPRHPETQFFFNDRDVKTGKVFTVLYDITADKNGTPGKGDGARVREYRYDDCPVANGGVAQDERCFFAINYARLARMRPATGYKGATDWTTGVSAPEDDGIYRIETDTGERTLIVSFAQLREAIRPMDPKRIDTRHLFINHTLPSRDSGLLYFFCRADFETEKEGSRINIAFTVRQDGTGLTAQPIFIGGHPDWDTGTRIIGSRNGRQVIYDTASQKIVGDLGGPELFANPEGDIAVSPDARWFVNGDRIGSCNHYVFLDRETGRTFRSPGVYMADWSTKTGALRLDPAPAWNREGNAIVVPGIAADGTRQMFMISLPG